MISLGPTILCMHFAICSVFVWRCKSAARARSRSLWVATVAVVFGAAFLAAPKFVPTYAVGWMPKGLLSIAPFVTALVAFTALGTAPLATHAPATFARMMLLFAIGEGFVATDQPLVLVPLWAASSGIAWAEFRKHCDQQRWDRVFALYHLASLACFATGAVLLWQKAHGDLALLALLAGIAIREGVVPVHSWFPRFVEHAPLGIVVAFVAPQLGVYAHLELLERSQLGATAPVVAGFAAVTAVLAAMLGVVQLKTRRALAYLIISQTGLVAFGLEAQSPIGLVGALLNWQVLAIATSGFAMAVAALEARRGQLMLAIPYGSNGQTPKLGIAFLVLGFASVGFPLTLGFIAEDLLTQGTVEQFPLLGLSLIVATAFNGITVLRAFLFHFTGDFRASGEPDLSRRDSVVFGLAMAALLVFGMFPKPLVSYENPGFQPSHPATTTIAFPPSLPTAHHGQR